MFFLAHSQRMAISLMTSVLGDLGDRVMDMDWWSLAPTSWNGRNAPVGDGLASCWVESPDLPKGRWLGHSLRDGIFDGAQLVLAHSY